MLGWFALIVLSWVPSTLNLGFDVYLISGYKCTIGDTIDTIDTGFLSL